MILGTVGSLGSVEDIQTPGQHGKAFPRHAILAGFVAGEDLWRLQSQVVGQHSEQKHAILIPTNGSRTVGGVVTRPSGKSRLEEG